MAQVGDLVVTGRATFVNGIRGEVNPLYTNTYTGLIGSENTAANASFYVGKFVPTSYDDIWKIKIRIVTVAAGRTDSRTVNECYIEGSRSVVSTYHNFNTYMVADYRPIYYINIYRATSAGVTSGYGHLLGVGFRDSWSRTTAANSRTVTVEILETVNCTYTPWDTAVKYASVPGTGSTNYSALTELDGYNAGLRETGDDNTYAHQVAWQYYANKTSANIGIWQTGLAMLDGSDRLMSICTASDGTVTTANRTNATTKKANTYGFKVGSPVFYTNQSLNKNVNISDTSKIFSQMGSLFDSRYAFNTTLTAGSLTAYSPIYLVGTINSTDGLFYLDTTWWTQTPNDSSKIYIYVGRCFDSTTSNCRIVLDQDNPWYRYDGSKLVEFHEGYLSLKGGTMSGTIRMNGNNIFDTPLITSSDDKLALKAISYEDSPKPDWLFHDYTDCWSILYSDPDDSGIPMVGNPIANFSSESTFYPGSPIVVAGAKGKIIPIAKTSESIAINHNNTYRGEELLSSSHFGAGTFGLMNIHNAVSAGNFSDIYVGDTITVTMPAISGYESASQTVKWVVMGINIYPNTAVFSSTTKTNYLILVPKDCFNTCHKMNETDLLIDSTGYSNTTMNTTILPAYKTAINTSLGGYLLSANYSVTTNMDASLISCGNGKNGATTSINSNNNGISLLNEFEIFGSTIFASSGYDIGWENTQLPGFKLNKELICKKINNTLNSDTRWWLKTISHYNNKTYFCAVYSYTGMCKDGINASISANNVAIAPKVYFG